MRTLTACRIASLVLLAGSVSSCTPRAPAAAPTAGVGARMAAARLALALDAHVIVLDERGFGQSTRFADPARYGRNMADDVVRLLDHLHIQRAHLVGHSMGAVVAANVAIRYPERVASASLLAPPSYPDSSAFAQSNVRWVADLEAGRGIVGLLQWLFPHWPDSSAASANAATMPTNPPATLAAVMRSLGAIMVSDAQIVAARVPMLAAAGTRDPLLAQTRWIASRWPRARLLEIPGADHGTIVGDAAALAAIADGLSRLPARAQAYHVSAHTSTYQLAEIAAKALPGLLVLYHQLYFSGADDEELLRQVRSRYRGRVVAAHDLDVY